MKKYFETGLMVLCAAGFFGFIYPELCLTEDTVKVIQCEEAEENGPELIKRIYNDRLSRTPAQIRFRFRVLKGTK
jgi:hypothetical protein